MKLQPLYDLQQEINRLFIAGSKFSKGDPRIQKHIPVFNKLGEKAPVFRKIASDLEELLHADVQQSAEKLTALSTLLYSVLYTQGETTETDVEEKIQQPGVDIENVNTSYSYIQLKPVMEALTISNSGRLEILKDAVERNIFEDSRTFYYLVVALGDKYSELADYVEKTIIPRVGKPIIPFLLQSFTYEDKTENVRKLRLLHLFKQEKLQEMVAQILSGSLPNLQAEAVAILSDHPENESLIIKLADDKNKQVREAAYSALAKLNTRNSLEKLKDVYLKNKNKTNLPAIAGALASSKLPFFFQEVFDQVLRTWEEFISLEKGADDKQFVDKLDKLATEIIIFKNKDNEQVIGFFDRVFNHKKFGEMLLAKKNVLGYTVNSFTTAITGCLDSFEIEKALAFYTRNQLEMPDAGWQEVFCREFLHKAADHGYSKEKMYDLFASAFDKKVIRVEDLYDLLTENGQEEEEDEKEDTGWNIHPERIDQRWLPKIYKIFDGKLKWNYEYNHALRIIDVFEPGNSKKFNAFLVDLAGKVGQSDAIGIYALMIRRESPKRFETIYSMVSKIQKGASYYFYGLQNSGIWEKFPKDYIPKFKELYHKTKMELFNTIAEKIQSA
ncbi:hypothetical protein FACS1894182_02480 [Bacteroidia bacterium]|nr:hypothetical protein FACS1894182_02480 [Bacteroidia bacterium]